MTKNEKNLLLRQRRSEDWGVPLTVAERFTRVFHAIMFADDDTVVRETIYLVRAARYEELKRRAS